MNTSQEVAELFAQGGADAYFGERVTQLQHALQTAHRATLAKADAEVVAAALIHDIGHLLGGDIHARIGVIDHDRSCISWLQSRGFSDRLIGLVSGHVLAKRYLVARRPNYFDQLSDASKQTLQLQGGPLSPDEADAFEAGPQFQDLLRLRAWDEQAKDPEASVPELDTYLALIDAVASGGQPPGSLSIRTIILNVCK